MCITHQAYGASRQKEMDFNDDVKIKDGVLQDKRGKSPIEVTLAEREVASSNPTLGTKAVAKGIRMKNVPKAYYGGAQSKGPIHVVEAK